MKYPSFFCRNLFILFLLSLSYSVISYGQTPPVINFVFTSDVHYGIKRAKFRGDTSVASYKVNEAMIRQINTVPELILPADGGVNAGKQVKNIDYVAITGDIANRMDYPVQTASASWAQFEEGYMSMLKLRANNGKPAKLLLVPGNHDVSNAIGTPTPMNPLTDPTSMVKIYNLMLNPETPLTNQDFNYQNDKVNYSLNVRGIHLVFITLWPDSAERVWMEKDLKTVTPKTPVLIFTHDPPTGDAKHFTNPVFPFGLSAKGEFDNLVAEHYKEGSVTQKSDNATDIEQRGLVSFLKAHPNIKAYFHGHSNWNEYYIYHGPDNDINLNTFRVDSPMKGQYSAKDETKLSFQLISLDPEKQLLTAREYLWNTEPLSKTQKLVVGQTTTISLKVN